MKIHMADPDLTGNEMMYLKECIDTGWISSKGPFVKKFEEEFAKFCGVSDGCATSNGTVSLHVALVAAGIKAGDEVIIPNLTFASTANAVIYLGAKPVLVDVNRNTWNMDVKQVKAKITDKTKAIIPVHLYGNPCDMDAIMEIAKENGLFVLEDAAEAHGATYNGKIVGSIGHVGSFSFYSNKVITTGEGGICISNDKELIDKMKILKDHGMKPEKRYWHDEVAFNYRMTNMQAAIGVAQLERIEEFIQRRKEICKKYTKELSGVQGLEFQKSTPGSDPVNWMFSIIVPNRERVAAKLEENGIATRPLFFPLNVMPPYKDDSDFPNSDFISKNGLSLPTHTRLTDEQIEKICSVIKDEC